MSGAGLLPLLPALIACILRNRKSRVAGQSDDFRADRLNASLAEYRRDFFIARARVRLAREGKCQKNERRRSLTG